MPNISEGPYLGDWLKWEQDNLYSREKVTLAQDAAHDLESGAVLGELTASPGTYHQFDQDASDGTEDAAGVLLLKADATGGPVEVAIIKRAAIVSQNGLVWPGDIDPGEKTAAEAQLVALGILVREGA